MTNEVAIIIPYYRNELTEYEKISYIQCKKILGKYPIILIVPDSMDELEMQNEDNITIKKVPDEWLESISSYNAMMLNKEFYRYFQQYNYILIYQLDALVFSDQLSYFCNLGYDYIGAPWLHGMINLEYLECDIKYVGNGGFSLRKVDSFLKILEHKKIDDKLWIEDVFWSNCESSSFKVAPLEVALTFAFETQVKKCFELNQYKLPFGCHAWMKYDLGFWKNCLPLQNYELETVIGNELDSKNNYLDIRFVKASTEIIKQWISKRGVDNIYIWGAGRIGKLCGWPLKKASVLGCEYIDKDEKRWNSLLNEIRITAPESLKKTKNTSRLIIIAIKNAEGILEELEELEVNIEDEVISYMQFVSEINAMIKGEKNAKLCDMGDWN